MYRNGPSTLTWNNPDIVPGMATNEEIPGFPDPSAAGNGYSSLRYQGLFNNVQVPSPLSQTPASVSPFSLPVPSSTSQISSETGPLTSKGGLENQATPRNEQLEGYARYRHNTTPSHTLIEGNNWTIGANGKIIPTQAPSTVTSIMGNNSATVPRWSPTDSRSRPFHAKSSNLDALTTERVSPVYRPTPRVHLPYPLDTPSHNSPLGSPQSPEYYTNALQKALRNDTRTSASESSGKALEQTPNATPAEAPTSTMKSLSSTPTRQEVSKVSQEEKAEEERKKQKHLEEQYEAALQNVDLEEIYDKFPEGFLASSDEEDMDGAEAASGNSKLKSNARDSNNDSATASHPPLAIAFGTHGSSSGEESAGPSMSKLEPKKKLILTDDISASDGENSSVAGNGMAGTPADDHGEIGCDGNNSTRPAEEGAIELSLPSRI